MKIFHRFRRQVSCLLIICSLLPAALVAESEPDPIEPRVHPLFSNRMVLQRNQPVPVWGHASPGTEMTVEFGGQLVRTQTGSDGRWLLFLEPMKASGEGRTLKITDSSGEPDIELVDVLVGDVWVCAGQSNMAQTMDRYLIWDKVKKGFTNPNIRLFKIKQGGVARDGPSTEIVSDPFFKVSWQPCVPEFAAKFSAAASFFGMELECLTGVPLGLLYANRGATSASCWLPHEVLEGNPAYSRFLSPQNPNYTPSKFNPDAILAPSRLYNGTIHPLAPFAIRGVIWYQGESDSRWSWLYADLFSDVIRSWRKLWGYDFPFLYVQLAPHADVKWDNAGDVRALIREAQQQVLEDVPGTAMVVITDAGEAEDIHPQAKDIPGKRLARLAASLDIETIDAGFPSFKHLKVRGNRASLRFDHVSGGLQTQRVAMNVERGHFPGEGPDAVVAEADTLVGFEVCGPDRVFHPAKATIVLPDTVEVYSPDVLDVTAVRYGWANFPLCNLYGGNGMPASPFRTRVAEVANKADPGLVEVCESLPVSKPNILLIIADDLNTALSGYGHPQCKTPNLDRLAAEGTRFTRAYCQYPLCGPSRASLMSGRYPLSNGVTDNSGVLKADIPTLPQLFRESGYWTGRVSKIFHMGVPGHIYTGDDGLDHPESWTERYNVSVMEALTPGKAEDVMLEDSTPHYNEYREKWQAVAGKGGKLFINHGNHQGDDFVIVEADVGDEQLADGVAANKTIELLKERASDKEPFFLAVGFVRPHVPFVAPRRSFDRYPVDEMQVPEVSMDDLDDVPGSAKKRTNAAKFQLSEEAQRKSMRGYYASVSYMDEQVGRLIDTLDTVGLRDSTIVVFLSDHGYHLGEHTMWQKLSLFEESIRTPLIVSIPGQTLVNGKCASIVELIDIYPTIAEIAGLDAPEEIQGQSFVPLLKDADADLGHKDALIQVGLDFCLRTSKWAFMRYSARGDGINEFMLYDMQEDPEQFTNLVGNRDYSEIEGFLRKRLEERIQSAKTPVHSIKDPQ
ncbi:sulfatase-like hydrolase/transferase [Puniceicoccales bacterium CK1056]|uniref:Sulfatase-like hydrolase/transferase n=1 Tax=Oceanipulchritudo coccoides TaxID=2706888 RepID=A0A6B2M1D4_9BACT|nr:sulfatase-like hydrolase/transferase [Oceanipulchritudo coccoides]NDV61595.1 sulfatase-like hydrolase/transferase [Oceanipulchritudo coccoides]